MSFFRVDFNDSFTEAFCLVLQPLSASAQWAAPRRAHVTWADDASLGHHGCCNAAPQCVEIYNFSSIHLVR